MTGRSTGRQLATMVIAACVAVIAAPAAVDAAVATFSSASATTPALSAQNTSSGSGAKAVYGNASATTGTIFGWYGRSGSRQGYGVYSAGRLGISGPATSAGDPDVGTINVFTDTSVVTVRDPQNAVAFGYPLSAVPRRIGYSADTAQVEGTATYRRNSTGTVVTISFHIYGANCEVFGNLITAG